MRMIWNGCFGPRVGFAIVLCVFLCCNGMQSFAAENLECPEIGPGRVPDLIGDATGAGLFATENFIDLANEINEAISRLEISAPDISRADVQNVLIAAYCRVVAHEPGLAAPTNGAACASSQVSWSGRWQSTRCQSTRYSPEGRSSLAFRFLPMSTGSSRPRLRSRT